MKVAMGDFCHYLLSRRVIALFSYDRSHQDDDHIPGQSLSMQDKSRRNKSVCVFFESLVHNLRATHWQLFWAKREVISWEALTASVKSVAVAENFEPKVLKEMSRCLAGLR